MFNKAEIKLRLVVAPILAICLSGCSLEAPESTKNSMQIELQESDLANSDSDFDLLVAPTTTSDFNCFAASVSGNGVTPASSLSDCANTDANHNFSLGLTSAATPRGSQITVDVPVGYVLNIDVYGIVPGPSGCGSDLTGSYGYFLGGVAQKIVEEATVIVPIAFTAGTTSSFTCGGIPKGCAYSSPTITYTSGIAITSNTLTCSGGASATSYSISPNLNAATGLSFNSSTGVISGTPTIGSLATSYTVTASNIFGSATVPVTIGGDSVCTRTVVAQLAVGANTLPSTVSVSYSMVGGGGGGGNGAGGVNGTVDSGSFMIPAGQTVNVFVGGGGGAGGSAEGGGGGGGSSSISVSGGSTYVANGGAGANMGIAGGGGAGGTNAGGTGGAAGSNLGAGGPGGNGSLNAGGMGGAGNAIANIGGGGGSGHYGGGGGGGDGVPGPAGSNGGNATTGGVGVSSSGGGGGYGGGGASGGFNGGTTGTDGGGGASGGLGAITWTAATTLPAAAGQGGGGFAGGNAGLVILSYSHTSCPL